jgi:hypothetical protein
MADSPSVCYLHLKQCSILQEHNEREVASTVHMLHYLLGCYALDITGW